MDDMNSEVDCQAKGPRQGGDAEARVSQLGMGSLAPGGTFVDES